MTGEGSGVAGKSTIPERHEFARALRKRPTRVEDLLWGACAAPAFTAQSFAGRSRSIVSSSISIVMARSWSSNSTANSTHGFPITTFA